MENHLNSKTLGIVTNRLKTSDANDAYGSEVITVNTCVPSDKNIATKETGFLITFYFDENASVQIYITLSNRIFIRSGKGKWHEK